LITSERKSNSLLFAETELEILVKAAPSDNRPIVEEFIPQILALVNAFGNSGQSGGSAGFVAAALGETVRKLCLMRPIGPIMDLQSEWCEVSERGGKDGEKLFQNRRLSSLFREGDGQAYYLDAIAWETQKGHKWNGTAILPDGKKIGSRAFVRNFPFEPKTFIIHVEEREIAKDDWELYIVDEKELDKVKEMYELYEEMYEL
jgi:hypothetical protein